MQKLTQYIYIICISICCLHTINLQAQEKHTLNGYIRDMDNGEELIGVTVYIAGIKGGTITNHYGFYSITLEPGTYQVSYSYIGFKTMIKTITLEADVSMNIDLVSEAMELEDVVIKAEREDVNVQSIDMSTTSIDVEQVKLLPSLFGEADIIKNVQMQPGVATAGEGTSGYFVRGGTSDQNLILIDEAPIYDPSHLFGLFSVFNADVIKDSDLIKGGIPSQYGGRLSSILDVRTKDGNNKKIGGSAGIGLLASRLMIEGPLKKESSSFIVSARRSYADLLNPADRSNRVFFYDFNAKVNWRQNNNNRFFLSAYFGRDVMKFGKDGAFGWGNATATLRWNHLFNERLFANTSVIFSNFDYNFEIFDEIEGLEWTAGIQQTSFKEDFTYYINPTNELSFGYQGSYKRFSPGKIEPNSDQSLFKTVELERLHSLEHNFYIGNESSISNKVTLQYGIRYTIYQNVGESTIINYLNQQDNIDIVRVDSVEYGRLQNIKTFHNIQPRLSARYMLTSESSLKASYNRMVQNEHLLSNAVVSLPFNTWWPSSPYISPQLSDQVALGYFRNLKNNTYEMSAEIYYKKLDNLATFADNAQVFFNPDLATEIRNGESSSYGLELYVKKNKGNLKGFVSYTLSKTDSEVPGVNNNRIFPASHDRRHNLSAVATYKVNDKWTLGANFVYNTGRPFTLPVGKYRVGSNYNLDYYTGRNEYRLPDFHRLDFSATLYPKKNEGRKWKSSWTFALYNVYNRQNPFTIYTRTRQDSDGNIIGDGTEKEARLIYLFPILPSFTYNIKF